MKPSEKELDIFELELAIKWTHAASLMDANPEVSYFFDLSETALKEKLERLKSPQPPNAPLTLEELREMDGEPVWVDFPKCPEARGWMLVSAARHCIYDGLLGDCDFENCGKTWLAYRRKPEEGTNAST